MLFDWSLSHELGHRPAGHGEHAQPGDPGYLDAEQEADRLGFDLFRASWGWRSGLLERVPLDEAGRIFFGPVVFFHAARLLSILSAAVYARLGADVIGACDAGNGEQAQRARRWLETAVAWIQSLEGTSAALSAETRERIEAFADNLTGFGDHVAAVVQKNNG